MQANFIIMLAFVAVIICDVILSVLSFRRGTRLSISLGMACLASAVLTLAYFISCYIENYFVFSLLSSLYFAGIDVALFSVTYLVRHFTKGSNLCRLGCALKAVIAYIIFDIIVLLINPFKEIAISYYSTGAAIQHYGYSMHLLYRLHLVLDYFMVALVLYYLVKKALKVPNFYRRQFDYAIVALLAVVGVNAVYLYMPMSSGNHILDYSLIGYSATAMIFYWICFVYPEHGMLDQAHGRILESMEQGVLLFDYKDELITSNNRAREIIPELSVPGTKNIYDMLRILGIREPLDGITESSVQQKMTFQCYPEREDGRAHPVRCDFSSLCSHRGELLGHLFVLTDISSEYDSLTGFLDLEAYKRSEEGKPEQYHPVICVVCDINALADINAQFGNNIGDKAIQALAINMLRAFPENTVFVRGREAILSAVCEGLSRSEAETIITGIASELRQQGDLPVTVTFQSEIRFSEPHEAHYETLEAAVRVLRTRKLMNRQSHHSDLLYSLVQALQAVDRDTEAHVKRTQLLSAELGKRIGLTEEEQSNLSLLAILHDIGKICIPLEILNKPGRLTESEWEVLKTHAEKGAQIVSGSADLRDIADMVLHHHERWDGKGYPDGLSKESIPLLSRVIAVVDSYDAMINERVYKKAMSEEDAREELRRCAGTQFDPVIVSEFLQMMGTDTASQEAGTAGAGTENAERKPAATAPDGTDADDSKQRSLDRHMFAEEETARIHIVNYSRYITEADNTIIEPDKNFELMTGYSEEDVRKLKLKQDDLIFEEDLGEYVKLVEREVGRKSATFLEHRIRRKDGNTTYVFCYGRRFYDSSVRRERNEIIISDSAQSYSIQSVVNQANAKAAKRLERWEKKFRRDPLTGLLNHEAFKSDVEARILSGEREAMMLMLDVDKFKQYNDTYGHRAGDELLIMVAQTLITSLRDNDFACRMGGDEFAAILFFNDSGSGVREHMLMRAQQICDKLNLTLSSSDDGKGTGVSMGAAFLSDGYSSFNSLYEAADRAMYRSKDGGRARLSV